MDDGYTQISSVERSFSPRDDDESFPMERAPSKPTFERAHSFGGEKAERIRQITSRNSIPINEEHKALSSVEALENMFSYLRIDRDGGILNLTDGDGAQYSKLWIFFKADALRDFVAFLQVVRAILNLEHVYYGGYLVLICFFRRTCSSFPHQVNRHLPLDIVSLSVVVFEILRGFYLLGMFTRDIIHFICGADGKDAEQGLAKRKYYALSDIFLVNFQSLQNFSALQCLGYVHPSILKHFMQKLTASDAAARACFERMLRDERQLSDDELHDVVIQIMMKVQKQHGDAHLQDNLYWYTTLTSYALFKELQKLPDFPAFLTKEFHSKIRDPEAMRHAWKVSLSAFVEMLVFGMVCMTFAFFGAAAFMVKLGHIAEKMTDSEIDIYRLCFNIALFLNQVMGIVPLSALLRERVVRFLFGGQDAKISSEEEAFVSAYHALLVERIWTVRPEEISTFRRCVVLLTLSDDDIQRLVLEESASRKAVITKGLANLNKTDKRPTMTNRITERMVTSILTD